MKRKATWEEIEAYLKSGLKASEEAYEYHTTATKGALQEGNISLAQIYHNAKMGDFDLIRELKAILEYGLWKEEAKV